jgi:hypothetical protein
MRPLDRCWTHVARSCMPWAASVTSQGTNKGSSQGPSCWGSSTVQQHSLHPPRIHAGESPANIQCKILKASHTRVGPHSPATTKYSLLRSTMQVYVTDASLPRMEILNNKIQSNLLLYRRNVGARRMSHLKRQWNYLQQPLKSFVCQEVGQVSTGVFYSILQALTLMHERQCTNWNKT